jgi:hypothetical protein
MSSSKSLQKKCEFISIDKLHDIIFSKIEALVDIALAIHSCITIYMARKKNIRMCRETILEESIVAHATYVVRHFR